MKIAVLSWGSLIWDPRNLKIVGGWEKGGPSLKIEFSRISKNGRLTLVIDEANGVDVVTRYSASSFTELSAAIEDLREREKTTTEKIGYVDLAKTDFSSFAQKHHPKALEAIRTWATNNKVDAVIWTALEPDFTKAGEAFSVMAAQRYYERLDGVTKAVATEYLQRAPAEVDTPVRRLLCGFVANAVSTGGAGTVLEHRFAASCVALMLCGGEMPLFARSEITEVSVQTGNIGWRLDDVLIQGKLIDSTPFRVAVQVKRTCAAVASDKEFASFIASAWADFTATSRFSRATDRLLLVSTYQTSRLVYFRSLIERAQATTSPAAWITSLSVPNFLSAEVAGVRTVIEEVLAKEYKTKVSPEELWAFLRACSVLLTDFDAEASTSRASITSLLRSTCADGNAITEAENTWNEIQTLVATEEGKAKVLRLAELPDHLRRRHGRARAADLATLDELKAATDTVLARSRDTILGVSIVRNKLEGEVTTALAKTRVALITGPAGSGKSAIAKRVFRETSLGAFALAFNVEEFAAANLRSSPAMHGLTLTKFAEVSALQSKRVVLVESLERLLEDNRRDAFLDFLRQIAADPSWHLVLTCRSSASVTVQLAFLDEAGLKGQVIEVPPLTDEELTSIAEKLPQLIRPLSSPPLKELLRQPFLLEKAATLSWPAAEPLPTGEKQFRNKVWSEIVRKNSVTGSGLPQRRATAFVELAFKRAKELVPFVQAASFDAEALQKLRDDGLVSHHQKSEALVAPAHDMLEDWALLQFLDESYLAKESTLPALVGSLEPFPALRRAYRKWLAEAIEADVAHIGGGIFSVITDEAIGQQWRDETIVAILRSSHASDFIANQEAKLLEKKGELLFRFIHLCRVAATTQSSTVPLSLGRLSMGQVPSGTGWTALARVLEKAPQHITGGRFSLVAKFIEDWAKSITVQSPNPPEAAIFCGIALRMLAQEERPYRLSESESSLVTSVLKAPLACKGELIKRIRADIANGDFDRHNKGFAEQSLDSFDGLYLCRDLPDLVVEVINAYLYETETEEAHHFSFGHREVDYAFGLRAFLALDGASPTASRGPWFNLLLFHPKKARELITQIMNRAAESYAAKAHQVQYVEPPLTVEIELPDGSKRTVISNSRLWGIYRGASVSPYVLQSMLMALESWLLIKAEASAKDLSGILASLVTTTNNSAMLAVVASVATAYPKLAGDAAVSIISSPQFFSLDLERLVQESAALEDMFGGISLDAADRVGKEERRAARKMPHRRKSVEDLCRELQFGATPMRERVWALLDRYRAEAGGDNPPDDDAAIWLNIVHRMDLRTFQVSERKDNQVLFRASEPPAGVKAKLEPHRPELDQQQLAMELMQWGTMAFQRQLKLGQAAEWRSMIKKAESIPASSENPMDFAQYGAGNIAAVAVRDHLSELTETEATWCRSRVIAEVQKDSATQNDFLMSQNHATNGDRACAYVVSHLLAQKPDDKELRETVNLALTHPVDEVRAYAAAGFLECFSGEETRLIRCLSAFAAGAINYRDALQVQAKKPWDGANESVTIWHAALALTRGLLNGPDPIPVAPVTKLRFSDSGSDLYFATVSNWLCNLAHSEIAQQFFSENAAALFKAWTVKEERQESHSNAAQSFETALARYLLLTLEPKATALANQLAAVIPKASNDVAGVMLPLLSRANTPSTIDRFWHIWTILAQETVKLPAVQFQRAHPQHTRLLQRLFIDLEGDKPSEADWALLKGRNETIIWFYGSLPVSAEATTLFLRYLQSFGEKAMPRALIGLAAKISDDPSIVHLNGSNVFLIEKLLSVRIFGTPVQLKSSPEVRTSTLKILDALVNVGSAAAFIMRDDFATPLRVESAV